MTNIKKWFQGTSSLAQVFTVIVDGVKVLAICGLQMQPGCLPSALELEHCWP